MLRFFKIIFSIIGIVLLLILLVLGGLWLKYRSVVDKTAQGISTTVTQNYPLSANVNSFIGTGGVPWTCAYNFPGTSLPFGMMRLSPETSSWLNNETALNSSGYFYGDNKIIGFSHTRLVGTGATDGGHFLILPIDGNLKVNIDKTYYHFSHEDELAYPGYYSVDFPDDGIKAELTSTERVGIHRYTFSDGIALGIMLDVSHALGGKRSEDSYLKIDPVRNIVEGHVRTFGSFAGRYGGIKVYFAAKFSSKIQQYTIWENDNASSSEIQTKKSEQIRAFFTFEQNPSQAPLEIKLSISHVSIENAWENMELETGGNDFDDIAEAALKTWESRLKSIKIAGGTDEQRINFYTALYRCFQMPTVFNDANGAYFGFDKTVHQADSFRYLLQRINTI